jgi:hypothetical protein
MRQQCEKGGNVFQLLQYRKPMKNPVLVEILEYWERLRDGRNAPLRSEVDPRQIENALEHAFILERVQADHVRFRIAGIQICTIMGMEVRGMPATSIIAPEGRGEFENILASVFDAPEIVELHLEAARPGVTSLSAQMLLLPLKGDQGEMSRILGCLVTEGLRGAPPCRFKLATKKVTRIVTTDFTGVRETVAGFSESPDVYSSQSSLQASQGQTSDRGNYLRLVKSAD